MKRRSRCSSENGWGIALTVGCAYPRVATVFPQSPQNSVCSCFSFSSARDLAYFSCRHSKKCVLASCLDFTFFLWSLQENVIKVRTWRVWLSLPVEDMTIIPIILFHSILTAKSFWPDVNRGFSNTRFSLFPSQRQESVMPFTYLLNESEYKIYVRS